ncbi:hypothetical protein ACQ4PT_011532 [Festuca glaucescens]
MAFGVSNDILSIFVPLVVYWVYSAMYMALDGLGAGIGKLPAPPQGGRGHQEPGLQARCPQERPPSAGRPGRRLELHHKGRHPARHHKGNNNSKQPALPVVALLFIVAMVVLDTYQYFVHRYMHTNKFLYKHIHSRHHTIVVPYGFGVLYDDPLQGFFMDHVAPQESTAPCFRQQHTAFHGIHHQLYARSTNFSQPFFVHWDKLFGTYMSYTLEERKREEAWMRVQLSTVLRRKASPIDQLVNWVILTCYLATSQLTDTLFCGALPDTVYL